MIKHNRSVFQIIVPYRENADWEWWCLLSADRHWDNPHSDLELQRFHLQQAKERRAACLDFGDLLDLMGGKSDKRSHKEGIRAEHVRDNYFDAVIQDAAEWFAPYGQNIAILGQGNHETAITKHHEINPTERLVTLLNVKGNRVQYGGYGGFVAFTFQREREAASRSMRILLRWEHGSGGGGAITKGMIQSSRRAMVYADADIVVSGHVHEEFKTPFMRATVDRNFAVVQSRQTHIQLPTYKNEWEDGHGGYHIEKGRGPRPIGATWLRFYFSRKDQRILFNVIEAQ